MLREERIEKLTNYIEQSQARLYKVAYSYVKDKEAAIDVLQEAITKAIHKIYLLRDENYLTTWFYRILINEAINYIRKHKIEKKFYQEDYEGSYETEEHIQNIDLYKQIDTLNPKLKTIIILRFFEDKKLSEIAKITKAKESTVKSRLYKALEELKIKIGEEIL